MATSKQIYYTESLIGKAIVNDKVSSKKELWDALDLLPQTKLEDLSSKEISNVIKTLTNMTK